MRRWQRRALAGCIVAAGCLLLGEAGVTFFAADTIARSRAPVPGPLGGAPYLPGNPYLLWEMIPGDREELGVLVSVNTDGLRGPELAPVKPAGVRRVVVLGDSTVYGHGVAEEATFVRRLGSALGPSIEVINGGVPGYSTEQSLNLLELRLWDMRPDLIVVASMWSDNNFDSFVDGELVSRYRAFEGRWSTPLVTAAGHSAVYRYLDWHLRIADREAAVREVGWMLGKAPQGDRRRVPVNAYARNLQRIVDGASTRGAQVAFIGLANNVDLGAQTPGARAWTLYRQVMAETALRNQAPLVDVTTVFEASGLTRDDLFLDEMHPTAAGHAQIAEALGKALQPWLDGGTLSTASHGPVPTYRDRYSRASLSGSAAGPAPGALGEVLGTIRTVEATPLQIDALARDPESGEWTQVAGERLAGPGAFALRVPTGLPIRLRVYRDAAGDGPGPGDPLFSFEDQPIQSTEAGPTRLEINLDEQTLVLQ